MDIPSPDSTEAVADCVELRIACTREPLSKAQLSKYIEGAAGEEPEESFVNGVWDQLKIRQGEYRVPPFRVLDKSVRSIRSWRNLPGYLPCLVFSVYGGSEELAASAKIFERITAETLKNYCGLKTKVFGWPIEEGDPKDIETRARALAQAMNERFVEPPDKDKKDDTLDVAAWKPFSDSRCSQIVILMQCGIGKRGGEKANTMRLRAWKQYIHWGAEPISGFAMPSIIPPKQWMDLARNGELLLDRIRIYNAMSTGECDKALAGELVEWCHEQIKRLPS